METIIGLGIIVIFLLFICLMLSMQSDKIKKNVINEKNEQIENLLSLLSNDNSIPLNHLRIGGYKTEILSPNQIHKKDNPTESRYQVIRAWIARNENGLLYLHTVEPKKSDHVWLPANDNTVPARTYFRLDKDFWYDVKWINGKPLEISFSILR